MGQWVCLRNVFEMALSYVHLKRHQRPFLRENPTSNFRGCTASICWRWLDMVGQRSKYFLNVTKMASKTSSENPPRLDIHPPEKKDHYFKRNFISIFKGYVLVLRLIIWSWIFQARCFSRFQAASGSARWKNVPLNFFKFNII